MLQGPGVGPHLSGLVPVGPEIITSDSCAHWFGVVSRHPCRMTTRNIRPALPNCSAHFCNVERITLAAFRVHYDSAAGLGM